MNVVVVSAADTARIVARATGVESASSSDQLIDQVIAEYFRQALCTLSQGGQPVYITRLMNTVRRHLAPLWPEVYAFRERRPSVDEQRAEGDVHPDRVRRVLNVLSDLRDLIDLGDGYWLPAPVRLVSLPGSERALVVGGLGTTELRRTLYPEVALVGFARIVTQGALPDSVRCDRARWQSYEAWCGDPPSALKEWTMACMAEASRQLRQSANDFSAFEVYAPWLRRGQPQYFRWMQFEHFLDEVKTPPQSLLLCRSVPQRLHGPRNYWLGIVGSYGLKKELSLPSTQARRLAYGMDLL